MASVSVYLNFKNNTEEAFNFYKSVFGGEFDGKGIMRMSDAPQDPNRPLKEEHKNLVMHVSLTILGGFQLMGTDAPDGYGFNPLVFGNNVYINLQPDSRGEVDRIFAALSEGGVVEMKPQEMFWGDYFGSLKDKFGVQWMFNTSAKA